MSGMPRADRSDRRTSGSTAPRAVSRATTRRKELEARMLKHTTMVIRAESWRAEYLAVYGMGLAQRSMR